MAREVQLWRWLKRARARVNRLDLHRVENMLERSMPDVEGCFDGREFRIELKRATMPVRQPLIVRTKFQEGQSRWLARRWNVGGRAWLLLAVGVGSRREILLLPGAFAHSVEAGVHIGELRERSWTRPYVKDPEEVIAIAAWGSDEGPRRLEALRKD